MGSIGFVEIVVLLAVLGLGVAFVVGLVLAVVAISKRL
ncbi:hypothetical protein ACTIVE_5335 [Actinomadura verrucosospora]|uniref:Uncharacterized protein n=1 Tax=Actinomadura verrucosospora TaxID=46165 RepID=A0A7D3W102_ACTVE|nr:hypothetical protein ACTIVE_5335 [Actinomadura verrucosospora]